MSYELGTKAYADYIKNLTPGQGEVKQNKQNAKNIEEKAVSQQQQKLMGLAYAVKKGDIDAPSEEIQKLADSMSLEELKKMAEGKHKDLPIKAAKETYTTEKKEEIVVPEEIADEDAAEFITKAAAAKKAGKKSFTLGGKTYPVTIKTDVPTKNEAVSLDGRTKLFKEKLKKLAYEKAEARAKKMHDEEAKKDKKEEIKNKIKINPVVKEERKGYKILKKYRDLMESQKSTDQIEEQILQHLKEKTDAPGLFTAVAPEGDAAGYTLDGPASASSIARAFKLSPVYVQAVLDKMVQSGTISRVGDAYSYGSTSA